MKNKLKAAKNAKRAKIRIWALVPLHGTKNVPASSTLFPAMEIEVSRDAIRHMKKYLPLSGDMFGVTLEPTHTSKASIPQRFHD